LTTPSSSITGGLS